MRSKKILPTGGQRVTERWGTLLLVSGRPECVTPMPRAMQQLLNSLTP